MKKDDVKRCKNCGCTITTSEGDVGTGYALSEAGDITCYKCCAESEKQYMIENGRIDLYAVVGDNYAVEVTNWPGTLRFPVKYLKIGKHNIAKVRRDVWFDFDGYVWHGVQYGNSSEVCHCRKTKRRLGVVGGA